MLARIYRPTKNAMQSGRANTRRWVLEFEPEGGKTIDPLMGWTGSADQNGQVRLRFDTAEAAIAWCTERGIAHEVLTEQQRSILPKAYADNFRFDRIRRP